MSKSYVELDGKKGVSRRQFLKTGAGVLMGTLAASSGILANYKKTGKPTGMRLIISI